MFRIRVYCKYATKFHIPRAPFSYAQYFMLTTCVITAYYVPPECTTSTSTSTTKTATKTTAMKEAKKATESGGRGGYAGPNGPLDWLAARIIRCLIETPSSSSSSAGSFVAADTSADNNNNLDDLQYSGDVCPICLESNVSPPHHLVREGLLNPLCPLAYTLLSLFLLRCRMMSTSSDPDPSKTGGGILLLQWGQVSVLICDHIPTLPPSSTVHFVHEVDRRCSGRGTTGE